MELKLEKRKQSMLQPIINFWKAFWHYDEPLTESEANSAIIGTFIILLVSSIVVIVGLHFILGTGK